MKWSELRLGDTVEIGSGLMTLVKKSGFHYTWMLLESGVVIDVDYTRCNVDDEIDNPNVSGSGLSSRFVCRGS